MVVEPEADEWGGEPGDEDADRVGEGEGGFGPAEIVSHGDEQGDESVVKDAPGDGFGEGENDGLGPGGIGSFGLESIPECHVAGAFPEWGTG